MAVHLRAWERLIANPDWPTLVFASTGTKLMHDLIVQEAAKELDYMPGVHKIAHDKSVRYLIEDRVLFRFKKGNRAGLGSNIDTQANDDFIDAQVDLLGIPEAMKVELLWYPNRLRTKLDRVNVTARDGKKQAEGQITLTFSNSPMALIGWTVSDAQGQATRIRLSGLQRASGLAPTLFVLNDPRPKSVGRAKM